MSMTVEARVFTADELLEMPDDGFRHELVEGELQKMSPAGSRHGRIAGRIMSSLGAYVRQHRLGEVFVAEAGFLLARNPDTVLVPDGAFVRAERMSDDDGFVIGTPDVALEVISPSDRFSDVVEKTVKYLRYGTSAVIVVEPRTREITVHRPTAPTRIADVLEVPDVIPGWKMPLAEIFES
jgi:Uma2 family endonuclease